MSAVAILYTHPDNPAEFERRYLGEYVPLVRCLPGMRRVTLTRVVASPLGEPVYYRMETWSLLPDARPEVVLDSQEWQAAQDTLRLARGLSTIMVIEDTPVHE